MIFVGDMADILSKDVSFAYLSEEVIQVATSKQGRRHIWMLLTKQPGRMVEFAQWLHNWGWEWPANVWAGTSVTTQKTADNRIPHLLRVPAKVRFLSVEPMLGPIDLTPWLGWSGERMTAAGPMVWVAPRVDLVIFGGESGPDARPCDLAWIRDGVRQCKAAGVSAFVKQLGANPTGEWSPGGYHPYHGNPDREHWRLRDSHGGDWSEWPEDLRVREMPRVQEPAS
jgi:protein gp37